MRKIKTPFNDVISKKSAYALDVVHKAKRLSSHNNAYEYFMRIFAELNYTILLAIKFSNSVLKKYVVYNNNKNKK